MDSFEKFDETSLQRIEAFYPTLQDRRISEAEYEHPKKVWSSANMSTLDDYHD